MKKPTYTESFTLVVPASTAVGKEVSQQVIWNRDGKIEHIVLFFPTGVNATTGVFFTIEGEQVFPKTPGTYIALDASTIDYPVNIEAHRGDKVKFWGNNTDSASHTVRAQVTATIEEGPEERTVEVVQVSRAPKVIVREVIREVPVPVKTARRRRPEEEPMAVAEDDPVFLILKEMSER